MDFRLKILVVDDEPLVSSLLKQTLESAGHEVEIAHKGSEATKLAKSFDPDLVLMDVDLGSGPDGIDVASAIKFQSPSVSIAFLTNVSEPRLAGKSAKHLPAGSAYLHKDRITDPEVLLTAIEETARGRTKHLRDDLSTGHNLKRLSNSQLETIRLLAAGKSNEEIAQLRGTTVRAVRLLLVRAYRALGIDEQGGSERRVKAALEFIKASGLPN